MNKIINKQKDIKILITAYVLKRDLESIRQSLIEKIFDGNSTLNEIHNWLNDHDGEELTLSDVKFNYINYNIYEDLLGKYVMIAGEREYWSINRAMKNKGLFTPKLIVTE